MLINTKDAKKFSASDKQRQIVYSMDRSLEDLINDAYYPKLYKGLSKDADLFQLGQNIANDFGLHEDVIRKTNQQNCSYYMGYVYLTPLTLRENCLETLIHEFAHLFCDYFFRSEEQKGHDGHFMATLRWLFNHYDILSTEKFNHFIETNYPSIEVYDDFIHTFEFVDKETLDSKFNQAKESKVESSHTAWTQYNTFKREQVISEDFIEYFIENTKFENYIYIKVRRTSYEKNYFFNTDIETMRKTVLLSPPYVMDTDGERITNRNYFPAYLGYCDVDGSLIDNNFGVYKYPVRYIQDISKEGRKEINRNITEYSKELKSKGINVIKTKSEKEFTKLYWEMKSRCRELTDEKLREVV